MNIYALFPTLVVDMINPDHSDFKQVFLDNAFKHMDAEGLSSESTGNVDVHTDPAFESFFKFVSDTARSYVSVLNIDPNIFEFNLVKCWLNITKENDNPVHDHADAHLSFAYYINVPEHVDKQFVMYNPHTTNNLYNGMLKFNISEYNMFNSSKWSLATEEGKLLLFPSTLKHSVMSPGRIDPVTVADPGSKTVEELLTNRICIAGDFILTHKNKTEQFLGLQPIQNWRTF